MFFQGLRIIVVFAAMWLLVGCGGKVNRADFDNDLPNCPQKPSAFFAPTMRGVTAHAFALNATKSVERVAFDNGSALEIIQSGCAHINQQFVFNVPRSAAPALADTLSAAFWADIAVQQFNNLSRIDPKLAGLAQWSTALQAVKNEIKIQEPLQLEPHRFLSLDRIVSENAILLLVSLSEN